MTTTRRRRALPALLLLTAGALALAGCADLAHPAPSATALPDGITATLLPAGPEERANQVRMQVVNDTGNDLSVTKLRITDPRFVGYGRPTAYGAVSIASGEEAEIVITLPNIVYCDGDRTSTGEGSATEATAAATAADEATATATATPTPSPSATGDDEEDETMLVLGFTVGPASGVTNEQLTDPDGIIDAYVASLCGT
ncbi:MAG: hypothetical protein QM626_11890 [Microbacterium sp.]|uniref:hypothetical protein n=1 Tax=Microbacterium sp. TaxID=51671 RepID=UPI0039E35317